MEELTLVELIKHHLNDIVLEHGYTLMCPAVGITLNNDILVLNVAGESMAWILTDQENAELVDYIHDKKKEAFSIKIMNTRLLIMEKLKC